MPDDRNDLAALSELLTRRPPYLIVSPPRSASTALARALFQHSAIGPYIHEPCDRFCHRQAAVSVVTETLVEGGLKRGALIKEMTFQWQRDQFYRVFFEASLKPIVFLLRDPFLTLESRLKRVAIDIRERDDTTSETQERLSRAIAARDFRDLHDVISDEVFPVSYTGWNALEEQVVYCRSQGVPFLVVEAGEFRSEPEKVLRHLCDPWGLEFETGMVDWSSDGDFTTGQMPEQANWYRRVLDSKGIQSPTETALSAECFPERFHDHLVDAQRLFENLLNATGSSAK